MANTPEDETSTGVENTLTEESRIARLIKERHAALYTRYPHLPDPFAALALHLYQEFEAAKSDSEEAGTLNFRAHIIRNRIWIGYREDTTKDDTIRDGAITYADYLPIESRNDPFLKPILALGNARDRLDAFNTLISNVGHYYIIGHDAQDGSIYVFKGEHDHVHGQMSDWQYLAAYNTLHTVLDYWEEDVNVLDKKAEDNVPGVIPTLRFRYAKIKIRKGERVPERIL